MEHKDYFLVIALGQVMARRTEFANALKEAKKIAEEQDLMVTIEAVEQVSVTRVGPNNYLFGRTE